MEDPPGNKQDELLAELLPFFKALADPQRLRIVGLLANQELSVEQLAELLGLRPSTVSHHLSYLSHVGLVSARAKSYYNLYRLENGALDRLAQRLLQRETLQLTPVKDDLDSYDRKVIANFTDAEGRIKILPAQRKKLEAILRYVLRSFEPGVRYSEKRVNEILSQYNKDTATLRRELVEYHMLVREGGGGEYWIPEDQGISDF
jgi:predicted transcriptional regulator